MMTPDELITEIFRIQEEYNPDADPGDIDITIQDDMPLVVVRQKQFPIPEPAHPAEWLESLMGVETHGDSIQDALEKHLEIAKEKSSKA